MPGGLLCRRARGMRDTMRWRTGALRVAATAILLLASGIPTAVAADAGHGDDPATPFAGTIINAIVTLVIFLTVLWVLRKFAWGPILAALQKREDFIRDSLTQAKKDRAEAEATLKAYTDQLDTARGEATAIVEEGRRDAEVVRQRVQSEARTEADNIIARAKREIDLARDEAIKDLYDRTAEMATVVAARAIRKELTPEEHDRLLSQSLEEIKTLGPNGTS